MNNPTPKEHLVWDYDERAAMAEKSINTKNTKKAGKTLKEKRAAKVAKKSGR